MNIYLSLGFAARSEILLLNSEISVSPTNRVEKQVPRLIGSLYHIIMLVHRQFTERLIHRAQSTVHNSPRTIRRSTIHRVLFIMKKFKFR
jgi:hypothetical protein